MKRLLLAFAALLMLSISASAQFGIAAGFTLPTDSEQVNAAHQFHAGITGNIELPLGFGIQPSLLYNVKETAFYNADDAVKTGYVELPVQVQWGLGKKETFRGYIFAEPFIGIAVYRPGEDKININSFEYGGGLGVGIVCFRHLQIVARYVWNIGKLGNIKNTDLSALNLNNSNGVQISTIVLF